MDHSTAADNIGDDNAIKEAEEWLELLSRLHAYVE
jgi:hypothetical protein